MKLKGIPLTSEQILAAQAIIANQNAKIIAPAGSGKTMTLLAGSRKKKGYGLNISFNKAIAIAATKKFPRNIHCQTGHSMAFGPVGRKYANRLSKINGSSLSQMFAIGGPGLLKSPANKAYQILETIRFFCYSTDIEISHRHVPTLLLQCTQDQMVHTRKNIAHYASKVWNEMININSQMPITHDIYLKLWALSEPIIRKDFILFDETQDANPVILGVIIAQECQKIIAGDPFQQIYSWRGAVNALQKVNFDAYYISQSFRYGQAIADLANKVIQNYSHPQTNHKPIKGNDLIESIILTKPDPNFKPDCIICRTNAGVIKHTIYCQNKKLKVHIQGDPNHLMNLIRGIKDLKHLDKSYHPELRLFGSYDEFKDYIDSPMGGDLRYISKLIDKFGFETLIKRLNDVLMDSDEADITITTVHKAKGLEWNKVKLANDFRYPDFGENISQEEVNILYVALTRALRFLDISECEACRESNFRIAIKNWGVILKR